MTFLRRLAERLRARRYWAPDAEADDVRLVQIAEAWWGQRWDDPRW
jgi:hypothetical protein